MDYKTRKQSYIDFYLAGGLPLFRDGKPNRGGSGRCAFWDGFNGVNNKASQCGLTKASYDAGQHCAKHYPMDAR